jgi:hypothetical protein
MKKMPTVILRRRMTCVCAEGERRQHLAGMAGSSKLDGDGTPHDGSSSVNVVVFLELKLLGGIVKKISLFFLPVPKNFESLRRTNVS